MFEFASPWFLLLLLLLPLVGWRLLRHSFIESGSVCFSDFTLLGDMPRGRAVLLKRWLPLLRLLALALLIMAAARPRFGTVERDVVREGVDIFYCLDVSNSMKAEDFNPNRLEKAKGLTAEFARKRPMDRQGIVLFAESAFIYCPLTFDTEAIEAFLRAVDFGALDGNHTAIGMGLARAVKKLRDTQAKSKVVILMTDGDNNAGEISPDQAVEVAKQLGVRVYTIGLGSLGYAYVTVNTPYGPRRQRMAPNIDEKLLRKIADETGGFYQRATTGMQLRQTLDRINALEKTEIEMQEYRTYDERMALFVWVALVLLAMEFVLNRTRLLKIP